MADEREGRQRGRAEGQADKAGGDAAWREHEATQRARFGEGESSEDRRSPEQEQAGAASMVTGGGPIGTPQGPPASATRAAHLREDEGPADLGARGQTEDHGDDAPRGRFDEDREGREGRQVRDAKQRWPPV